MPIANFRHKGLRELFETGLTRRIAAPFHRKAVLILDLLDNMESPADCAGAWKFHALKGDREGSYALRFPGETAPPATSISRIIIEEIHHVQDEAPPDAAGHDVAGNVLEAAPRFSRPLRRRRRMLAQTHERDRQRPRPA
jgi:proteic killer suppression protein